MTVEPIRVAIVGLGNCASSLVQAIVAAGAGTLGEAGVAHPDIGGYGVEDIEVVTAFDVDARKVGHDVAEAIVAPPNCTTNYVPVPKLDVKVAPGPVADGVPAALTSLVEVCEEARQVSAADVVQALRKARAQVLVNYLPTGSAAATALYAEAAVAAGVAFVNCNPERIATDPHWHNRFLTEGLPLLGDDIRSQLGATRLHRALLDLCRSVGALTGRTYQLNHGGNTDFLNMREPGRAASKKRSKEAAISGLVPDDAEISAGPSGYVGFLGDQKVAYIRIEGQLLLGMQFTVETRLQVEDSPNSAGVVLDAVRVAGVARDRGLAGALTDPCSYLFKSPPIHYDDHEARQRFLAFASRTGGHPTAPQPDGHRTRPDPAREPT